ncbi:hypothetical protein ABB37_02220 [Leptomonas pyrrhocoris]|uniref:Uncharacterized protein n=1 Tax=Leptomonas pyrrhocoris TaxID=157538 RepID=A0A0N1J579_LEPPY|nr:hypothetical protein ABB37_02220 [Leptomonas pyrrhocoris]KPA84141.1 hypothetical protein ABB37_02220 [Leptomonas pyrrhocoris]|eukprot:XP_015662580.1 hypothetical protein ABB37_02220 [Leptomonas pyrrhocoris]
MGLGSSKTAVSPPPALSPETVEQLCEEAYTAGVTDADVYHTAQREAIQRQDAGVGMAACLLSAWLAYLCGRASGTRVVEEAADLRFGAQQRTLDKVNSDLAAVREENKGLMSIRQEQQMIIAQQRSELQRAAQQRKAMQLSVQMLKRRNVSVRRQLRGLTNSINAIQRQMLVGMVGAGVLLLAVVWRTRPLRRGRHQPPVTQLPEVVESVTSAPIAEE